MTERRVIKLAGACNIRDIGGYATTDGRRVKTGMVFRSDDLNELTAKDVAVLAGMNIATVIDFRDTGEAAASPDHLPATVTDYVNLPIDAGRIMYGFADRRLTRNKTMGIMISAYRSLVNDYHHVFREFFRIVSDPDSPPVLFHCTAGKDRTGVATALLLSALGVDRETVERDFLFSRELLKIKYVPGIDYDAVMEPLYSVMPDFLRAAFEVIDSKYGGMERYLDETLGVDRELLRTIYTEPRNTRVKTRRSETGIAR